ncbi:NAD(+) diphosphatase [Stappia sp. GBMRC 2046]|uniref:NAD(+) diphosphatase n=1 Tax=Stappia sediminis TaxID=2692190 RepID=A0A7X3LXF4_9HYPH|nr:NAD(+) diphosphatase [Stappia sediminis]MXN66847.1 NAD(+) diphosphatase [Stappia sediminis]
MSQHRFEPFAYGANPLDRLSEHRGDAEWFNRHRTSDTARFLLFSADRPVVDVSGKALNIFHGQALAEEFAATIEETVLLGFRPQTEAPVFSVQILAAEEEIERNGAFKLIDIRSLAIQGALPPEDLGILAQARALGHWHMTHGFCSRCGEKSVMTQGGYRRDCPNCGGLHFPRTDPVAIMLIADGDECLLGRPPRLAEGVYSTLAGFIEPGETVEDAVRREVFEESGIKVGKVAYRASQPWPFPASLMIGCSGEALSRDIVMDETELEDCRWFSRDEVRRMMAGEHDEGKIIPPGISIAHWLIREWVEGND